MHDSAWAAGPTPRHPSMDEDRGGDRYRDLGTPAYTPAETPGIGGGTPGFNAATPGFDAGTPGFNTGDNQTCSTLCGRGVALVARDVS